MTRSNTTVIAVDDSEMPPETVPESEPYAPWYAGECAWTEHSARIYRRTRDESQG